jgi:tetratricopeptide (TPR) repeat protein
LTLYRLIKEVKIAKILFFKKSKYSSLVSLTTLLVLLVFFSATNINLALLFAILGLTTTSKKIDLNLSAKETGSPLAERLPAILISVPVMAGLLAFGYYGQRALSAEATFKRSLDALAANDGATAYETMRQSISLNPYVDRYHASYTQVNLAIAQNLAQKEDLTDEDRQTVAQLIQQAIREAKATVTLNPQRSGNWQLLANTYRSILAFAQGADTFAIQSYNQAIALDPINPNLRIALGGMYYALGNYDQAIRAFELAVVAKPDLANAHYNLAAALREKGDLEEAINEMTTVLSLVERDSEDYEIAKAELENLEQRQTSGELEEGESLLPPQGAEEPAIEPPIELPEDSNPPEGEEVPTPSPTPTPEE